MIMTIFLQYFDSRTTSIGNPTRANKIAGVLKREWQTVIRRVAPRDVDVDIMASSWVLVLAVVVIVIVLSVVKNQGNQAARAPTPME